MTTPSLFYCEIPLTQGQVAIVDMVDFERLLAWKWYSKWSNFTSSFYANAYDGRIDGKEFKTSMHRQVLNLERGDKRHVDHINGNTLDNRRSNLRIVTRHQNMRNQKRRSDNTSGYRGVTWKRDRNAFAAQISINGKVKHLGQRSTAKSAYEELYLPASIENYGEFARLHEAAETIVGQGAIRVMERKISVDK